MALFNIKVHPVLVLALKRYVEFWVYSAHCSSSSQRHLNDKGLRPRTHLSSRVLLAPQVCCTIQIWLMISLRVLCLRLHVWSVLIT